MEMPHVPSPRQNVDALADVPLLRFVTGRFPGNVDDRSTGPHVGSPPASPCSTVVVVPMLASDLIDDVGVGDDHRMISERAKSTTPPDEIAPNTRFQNRYIQSSNFASVLALAGKR